MTVRRRQINMKFRVSADARHDKYRYRTNNNTTKSLIRSDCLGSYQEIAKEVDFPNPGHFAVVVRNLAGNFPSLSTPT